MWAEAVYCAYFQSCFYSKLEYVYPYSRFKFGRIQYQIWFYSHVLGCLKIDNIPVYFENNLNRHHFPNKIILEFFYQWISNDVNSYKWLEKFCEKRNWSNKSKHQQKQTFQEYLQFISDCSKSPKRSKKWTQSSGSKFHFCSPWSLLPISVMSWNITEQLFVF